MSFFPRPQHRKGRGGTDLDIFDTCQVTTKGTVKNTSERAPRAMITDLQSHGNACYLSTETQFEGTSGAVAETCPS